MIVITAYVYVVKSSLQGERDVHIRFVRIDTVGRLSFLRVIIICIILYNNNNHCICRQNADLRQSVSIFSWSDVYIIQSRNVFFMQTTLLSLILLQSHTHIRVYEHVQTILTKIVLKQFNRYIHKFARFRIDQFRRRVERK